MAETKPRIYVAGPMTGIPEYNYPAFLRAAQRLRDKGFAVLSPLDVDKEIVPGASKPAWEWYMRRTIKMLMDADAVALLPDWESSKGAVIEWELARTLGMDIRPIHEWLREPATAEFTSTQLMIPVEPPC